MLWDYWMECGFHPTHRLFGFLESHSGPLLPMVHLSESTVRYNKKRKYIT